MAQPNSALTSPPEGPPEPPAEDTPSRDLVALLRQAARLAAERGVDTDQFMQAAWAVYLEARPGLREELEDKELRAQLKKLRKRGLVAEA